jgi:hypothetical protein
MKLQIVSDLHLEFGDIEIPNVGTDLLILSGDITVAADLESPRAMVTENTNKLFNSSREGEPYKVLRASNR